MQMLAGARNLGKRTKSCIYRGKANQEICTKSTNCAGHEQQLNLVLAILWFRLFVFIVAKELGRFFSEEKFFPEVLNVLLDFVTWIQPLLSEIYTPYAFFCAHCGHKKGTPKDSRSVCKVSRCFAENHRIPTVRTVVLLLRNGLETFEEKIRNKPILRSWVSDWWTGRRWDFSSRIFLNDTGLSWLYLARLQTSSQELPLPSQVTEVRFCWWVSTFHPHAPSWAKYGLWIAFQFFILNRSVCGAVTHSIVAALDLYIHQFLLLSTCDLELRDDPTWSDYLASAFT